MGGFGYFIYVASFLSYNHNQNAGFNIFAGKGVRFLDPKERFANGYAGALLGVCAGLLWAAQGAIMLSYPQERSKGKYIAWFWMIFNLVKAVPTAPGLNIR